MLKLRKGGRGGPAGRRRQGWQAGVHGSGRDPKQSTGRGGGGCRLRAAPGGMWGCLRSPGNWLENHPLGPASHTHAHRVMLSHRPKEGAPSLLQNWLLSDLCHKEQHLLTQRGWAPASAPHRSHQGAACIPRLVKNLPALRETWVRSLDWEEPLEKETPAHSSTLAWRVPWTVKCLGSQRDTTERLIKGGEATLAPRRKMWVLCKGREKRTPGTAQVHAWGMRRDTGQLQY